MKKKRKIILIISFILLCLFIFVCQATNPFISEDILDTDYSNVLRLANERNKEFGDKPLTEIHLLASHDALSYEIDRNTIPNSNEIGHVVNNKLIFTIAKGVIVRYAKTQRHDALTQLKCGARLLDVRVTCIDNEYYSCHGVVSHLLKDSLIDILTFLDENPGEFVVFYLWNYYRGTSSDQELFDYISTIKVNNKNIFDYVNYDIKNETSLSNLTYNKLTTNGTKAGVFMFYEENDSLQYADYFKLSKAYSKHWELNDYNDKNEEMENHIKNIPENYDGFKVLQSQLTFVEDDIFGSLYKWSLLNMAEDSNAYMIDNPNLEYWLSKLPIYMCDYLTSTKNDFNNRINQLLLELNCR